MQRTVVREVHCTCTRLYDRTTLRNTMLVHTTRVTALDSCESETVNTYAESTNSNAYLVQSSKSFILLSGNMKQTAIPILITHNYFVLDALLKPDSPVSAFSVTYLFLAGTYSRIQSHSLRLCSRQKHLKAKQVLIIHLLLSPCVLPSSPPSLVLSPSLLIARLSLRLPPPLGSRPTDRP